MHDLSESCVSSGDNNLPIQFQFDSWQRPREAIANLAPDRLFFSDELTQRRLIAFKCPAGFRAAQACSRWLALAFGAPIPLTRADVAWDESSTSPSLVRRITPGWPADFSITLRCADELGGTRLRSHLDLLVHN
jgi:hypothetical protein